MEIFDVCDARGLPTGETVERGEAHRLGIRHRTAHVWVLRTVNGERQVLLQQRSRNKDSFPGQWDTSSAGHIPAGCEPLESALRELREELGIEAMPGELRAIGSFEIRYEKQFHGSWFRDNELANVFVYERPVELSGLRLQAEEVEAVDWFELRALLKATEDRPDWLCVPRDSLIVLKAYCDGQSTELPVI